MSKTVYGNSKCKHCGEVISLPGQHKCKPSYQELKAELAEKTAALEAKDPEGHFKQILEANNAKAKRIAELEVKIDQFWDGLWNRYNIESREEIEKDTKESWAEGTSPLNVALHYIWKREPKVAELEATVKHLSSRGIEDMQDEIARLELERDELESKVRALENTCNGDVRMHKEDDAKITELEAELAAEQYIVKQFGEWSSGNGCPASETKEGFCPDIEGYRAEHEKENLKLAEEDRFKFDSDDCETQINCGKCFAAYYRMKYSGKKVDESEVKANG